MFVGLLVLPMLVAVQLVRIQLDEGAELRARGAEQSESVIELAAERGTVFDRRGRALAVNTARYEVAADPTVAGFDDRAAELYRLLGTATGRGADLFRQRVRDRSSRQYVVLVRDLDEDAKDALDRGGFPGLIVTGSYQRRYNYGSRAAHVLGHVDRDLDGLAGVESQLDAYLEGAPGRLAVQRDRRGVVKAVVGGTRVEPRHGDDVVLTIDLVRQAILEEELARGAAEAGATWATAVALDPRTGAVLAMANVPTFDPNRAGAFSEAAKRNHAVVDRIEPGSTFKLVTAVAALESGAVDLGDTFDTGEGWRVFHGHTVRDARGYGPLTFAEGIQKSSNIAMALAAREIGEGPLYQAARDLGFGQPTTIDLPGEVAGSLRRPEDWGTMTLTSMSRGYAVEVTPLQLAVAYAALANGGLLVRPYVVEERREHASGRVVWRAEADSVRRAFREETARRLMPAFESVVSPDGTAQLAAVEGLRVAGKTGTAKLAEGGSYGDAYRASFVGMFPAEAPEVVLAVVMHRPRAAYSGGIVAAPVFGRVARRWIGTFPSIAERVAPSGTIAARRAAPVPAVDGLPAILAAHRVRAEGLRPRWDDAPWHAVASRQPAGDSVRIGGRVRLDGMDETDGDTATMPDLDGRSVRQAVAWLRALDVEPRVVGRGVVRGQSVAAGSALPSSVTIRAGA